MQKPLLLSLCMSMCRQLKLGGNPIISQTYTADPAARVFNDRMYVITSHDPDNATDYSTLLDYNLISSDDMVNWQDHGIVFAARKIPLGQALPTRRIG